MGRSSWPSPCAACDRKNVNTKSRSELSRHTQPLYYSCDCEELTTEYSSTYNGGALVQSLSVPVASTITQAPAYTTMAKTPTYTMAHAPAYTTMVPVPACTAVGYVPVMDGLALGQRNDVSVASNVVLASVYHGMPPGQRHNVPVSSTKTYAPAYGRGALVQRHNLPFGLWTCLRIMYWQSRGISIDIPSLDRWAKIYVPSVRDSQMSAFNEFPWGLPKTPFENNVLVRFSPLPPLPMEKAVLLPKSSAPSSGRYKENTYLNPLLRIEKLGIMRALNTSMKRVMRRTIVALQAATKRAKKRVKRTGTTVAILVYWTPCDESEEDD
jgi:hypothetical protein